MVHQVTTGTLDASSQGFSWYRHQSWSIKLVSLWLLIRVQHTIYIIDWLIKRLIVISTIHSYLLKKYLLQYPIQWTCHIRMQYLYRQLKTIWELILTAQQHRPNYLISLHWFFPYPSQFWHFLHGIIQLHQVNNLLWT